MWRPNASYHEGGLDQVVYGHTPASDATVAGARPPRDDFGLRSAQCAQPGKTACDGVAARREEVRTAGFEVKRGVLGQ